MEKNNKKSLTSGYIMAIIGFFLILYNALNYIFGWNAGSTPLFVIGIVFVVVGMGIVKKLRKRNKKCFVVNLLNIEMKEKNEYLKEVITFFIILTLITTGIFIWMFSGAKDSFPAVLFMMWAPGISAIITSIILKDKIRDYGWKPGKTRFLIYAYLLPLIISVIAYGLCWLTGVTDFTAEQVMNYKWAKMLGFDLPAAFLAGLFSKMFLGFLVACIPVLGEEIGWSGFLTPKLLKITSVSVTSLIVGIFWAVWHFPAIIGGFYGQGTPLWVALPGFTLVLVGYSFIRTVLVSKSISLWTGVVLHASGNTILMGIFYEMTVRREYTAYIVSETGIFTGIVCLAVALAFMKLMLKRKLIQESGE